MAYTDDQKTRHISELQRYLYSISHYNENIPRVMPDGIYGLETQEAVRAFQKEYGLPPTGEMNHATWNKLSQIYLDFNKTAIPLNVFPSTYILQPGSEGAIVYIIQIIINTLGECYGGITPISVTGIYNKETQLAIENFKNIAGTYNGKSGVDTDTWNKLASCFNQIF